MQVTLENLGRLERKLLVQLPSETISNRIEQRLEQLRKTVTIKGFSRPGTVPISVIQQRYGEAVFYEIAEEAMKNVLLDAFQEKSVTPVGMPQLKPKNIESGKPFEFEVLFEVMPEFELVALTAEPYKQFHVKVEDADLEHVLTQIQKQHAEWTPVTRAAKLTDKVVIDFSGTIEGTPIDRGSATDHTLELGSHSFIKGFEEGIVGHQVGDTFTLSIPFPEDYGNKDLAGKLSEFSVTVKSILEQSLPTIDDAFIQKMGIKEGGLDKLKAEVRKNIEAEIRDKVSNYRKEVILHKLTEKNPIDVPKALLKEEINAARKEMVERFKDKKLNDMPDFFFEKTAIRRVRAAILLRNVVSSHNLKVTDDQIESKLQEVAIGYDDKEKVIEWYKSQDEVMSQIRGFILEEMAFDKLLESMQIVPTEISYTEFANNAIQTELEEVTKSAHDDHEVHVHDEHCQHDHDHDHHSHEPVNLANDEK